MIDLKIDFVSDVIRKRALHKKEGQSINSSPMPL